MTMARLLRIIFFFFFFSLTGSTESGIVGGKVSKPHSRPYMASLQNQEQKCGGILIREDFVLTAAHCQCSWPLTVVLGAHNINKTEKTQQSIQVDRYYPHPKYNGLYDYDIMLIKLRDKAKLNKFVKCMNLPEKNEILTDVNCVVAGWGQTGFDKPVSDVLRETTEKIQEPNKCKYVWQHYFDTERMMCTMFDKNNGGICQGDSGGPIICNNKLQGLTAFTYRDDCNNPQYPRVFTKIHFYLPWIKEIMQA